jgi:type IV pilus assembly protein PilM
MSDVYLDWQKVEGNFGDIRKTYVLITAVPKQYVDRMLHMLDSARLKAVALEVESQATARSLISEQAPDQAVLILDIATSRTSIIIFDSGVLEFTASVPLGGQALTEAIARNLGIPTEEAEELKRRVGVSPGPAYQQVAGAMKPVLESLLAEIRNAMRFQEEHSLSRKKVQRILLSGGGARLSGLTGWLSSAFSNEVNVALGDPFCRFAKDGRKFPKPLSPEESLGFTTAIGLALRLMQ